MEERLVEEPTRTTDVSLKTRSGDTSIGGRQRSILYLALHYKGGSVVPITYLTEAFFHVLVDSPPDMYATSGDEHRAALFRTRRAVRALIERGLMEEAGITVSVTGDHGRDGGRLYKGYTRTCRCYRLTEAGRAVAEREDARVGQNPAYLPNLLMRT
jgi:hypothetical protein